MAVPETAPVEGLRPINYAVSCIQAIREAVGPDIDVMVDCHARPSPAMGMQFARALEPYGLYFLEEICWPEVLDEMADINRAVGTPIASGERITGIHGFRDLLQKRAASILQPDITHCGGLTEVRRIAALAEAYRVSIAPHNPQGPVSTAASLEFGFATPSYLICESVKNDVPWRDDIVQSGFTIEPKGQIVRPSDKPGLGIEINEDEVRKHPFQQEILRRSFTPDGAVTDW
jgi:galactonate dehydratase